MARLTDTEVETAVGEQGGYETLPVRSTEERIAMQQAGFPADYDERTVEPVVEAAPQQELAPSGGESIPQMEAAPHITEVPAELPNLTIRDQDHAQQVADAIRSGELGDDPQLENALFAELEVWEGKKKGVAAHVAMIDNTPVKPYTGQEDIITYTPGNEPSQENPSEHTLINNAAEKGIEIRNGAPTMLRLKMGLMDRAPEAALDTLEDYAATEYKKAFGHDAPEGVALVFKDPYAGRLTYMNPVQNGDGTMGLKPTWVNGVDAELSDLVGLAAEIVPLVPEVAASAAAGATMSWLTAGNPYAAAVGGASGSAAGAAAGDWVRREVARALGVPDEIADKIDSDIMLQDAKMAAGFDLLLPAVGGLRKKIQNKFRTLDHKDPETQKAMLAQIKEEARVIHELNETTGLKFEADVSHLTGDPELLVAHESSLRRVFGQFSKDKQVQEVRNAMHSAEAVRVINRQTVGDAPPSRSAGEAAVAAQEEIRTPLERTLNREKQGQMSLEDHMDEADGVYNQAIFRDLQGDLAATGKAAGEAKTKLWNKYRSLTEVDPETNVANVVLDNGPGTPIRQILEKLEGNSKNLLSTKDQKATQAFVEDMGKYGEMNDGLMSKTIDPEQLHRLLSMLKADQRQIAKGTSTLGWKGNDLKEVIGAIHTQLDTGKFRRLSSGRQVNPGRADAIRSSFKEASEMTRFEAQVYREQAIETVLATKNGRFTLDAGGIRGLVFKAGDSRGLADVLEAGANTPGHKAALAKELESMYRATTYLDGKWSPKAHQTFMNDYQDHIEMVMPGGSEYINNGKAFAQQVEKSHLNYKKQKMALESVYGKKLTDSDVYAGNVARDMLDGNLSIDQIHKLKQRLSKSGDGQLWADITKGGTDALSTMVLKKVGNEANGDALNKVLVEHGDRLGAIYGKDYQHKLGLLRDTMQVLERGSAAKGSRRELQPGWLRMFRTIFGPLSATQRRITAVNKLVTSKQDKNLHKALSDPELLSSMMKVAPYSPKDIRRIQVLGTFPDESLSEEDLAARSQLRLERANRPNGA